MFAQRLASALVLIPLVLAGVWLGSPYLDVLVAAFGAAMAWEWTGLCARGRAGVVAAIGILTVLGAVAASVAASFGLAFALVAVGAAAMAVAAVLTGAGSPILQGLGAVYIGVPCLALLWIRADPEAGLATLLWALVLVWAVDTGAYLAGRAIGGPKLAPAISPAKTWAGLGGGVLAAAAVGLIAGLWSKSASAWVLVAISAGLALVEQAGDLAESALKRHFGVKDSGRIIPGHGGVLDRVDGLMTVAVAVAGLTLIGGGSVLTWR